MTLEHEDVRERLIGATLDLMDEGGLEKVRARALAQTVGVSVGTVYNLFGNVDRLVQAACARIYGDLNKAGLASMAGFEADWQAEIATGAAEDTPKGRLSFALTRLARLYMDFVAENENRWGALLAFNRARAAGSADEWYVLEQDRLIEIISDLFRGSGFSGSDAEMKTLSWALWSSVHGIVSMSYVGQARTDAGEWTWSQIETILDLVVGGLFAR